MLDYWLELLVGSGVTEILINTHYFSELVYCYIARSTWVDNVTTVYERELLGTGGTVLANRNFFNGEPLLVAHADNLTIFDPMAFARAHRDRPIGCELTMMVFETPVPESCGIVELDQYGIVQAFHEKIQSPPGNLANAAVYILEPSVIEFMQGLGKCEIDLSTEVIPHFLGRISAVRNIEYHRDIGTMQSWKAAQQDFPLMCASTQNLLAWSSVLASLDGQFEVAVQQASIAA